jgi:hypothetical protein
VQYRVVVTKSDELVAGPDDADLVVTVPLSVVSGGSFDATAEYMRGRLKAAGSTGLLFDLLSSGVAASELSRLASRP